MRLWVAPEQEKPALARAYSAYMAELVPLESEQTPDPYFDAYWREQADRFPYIFGDDAPCGFAFIRRPEEHDIDFEMAEFCVYPNARRRGIGTRILPELFKRHAGRWEVSVLMTNAAGRAFWPKALKTAKVRDLVKQDNPVSRTYRFSAA